MVFANLTGNGTIEDYSHLINERLQVRILPSTLKMCSIDTCKNPTISEITLDNGNKLCYCSDHLKIAVKADKLGFINIIKKLMFGK